MQTESLTAESAALPQHRSITKNAAGERRCGGLWVDDRGRQKDDRIPTRSLFCREQNLSSFLSSPALLLTAAQPSNAVRAKLRQLARRLERVELVSDTANAEHSNGDSHGATLVAVAFTLARRGLRRRRAGTNTGQVPMHRSRVRREGRVARGWHTCARVPRPVVPDRRPQVCTLCLSAHVRPVR